MEVGIAVDAGFICNYETRNQIQKEATEEQYQALQVLFLGVFKG
jgi:hypothetical protein